MRPDHESSDQPAYKAALSNVVSLTEINEDTIFKTEPAGFTS